MPLYAITTPSGALSDEAKSELADRLTTLHSEHAGVPRNWVHIVFYEYAAGNGFTAGIPAAPVAVTVTIRTGRSSEYLRELLTGIWQLVQQATGVADDQLVIGIQEVPASRAMELGRIMPDVAGQ
ncbi:tautomerase family protein [Nocardia sp. NPDC051570]|uniref:tautomerase family protein n=1 Tax=Nocardia sp. NPDC051570 TaxID=3364324 RepID=UPI0037944EEF